MNGPTSLNSRTDARPRLGDTPLAATINGTANDDYLSGTAEADTVFAGAGNDTILSWTGNDDLYGGFNDDNIYGGYGDDFIVGGYGDDVLSGQEGRDVFSGSEGNDLFAGGSGLDTVRLANFKHPDTSGAVVDLGTRARQETGTGSDVFVGIENLIGTALADHLTGERKGNLLSGGGTGDDTLDGQAGDDTLDGGRDNDVLIGGSGDDLIRPGAGANTVSAGDGEDRIRLDADARTTIDGGLGLDLVSWRLEFAPDGLDVDLSNAGAQATRDGSVSLTNVEDATASEYDDRLTGTSGQNRLYGDAGDDSLDGGDAADLIYGDGFIGLDSRLGHVDPFHIEGSDDTLLGGGGDDTLIGGAGADRLTGGGGADVCRYFEPTDSYEKGIASPDLITDLEAADVIDLSGIDADRTTQGKQAFVLVEDFSGDGGELRLVYDADSNVTRIEADRNGDGFADFVITASGDHASFTGFIL